MKRDVRILASLLVGAAAASAGTITVQNLSSVTVPETRAYKTCFCACSAQIFGSLDLSFSSIQTRTSTVDGCVWARRSDPNHLYPSCSQMTTGLSDPSNPPQIIVSHLDGEPSPPISPVRFEVSCLPAAAKRPCRHLWGTF